jgi:hypothetical protein
VYISPNVVAKLEKRGKMVSYHFDKPKTLRVFSVDMMEIVREVCLDLRLPTKCGTLHVRGVRIWVATNPMPQPLGEQLLGSEVMQLLGFNENSFLSAAGGRILGYRMGAVAEGSEEECLQELEGLWFTPDFTQTQDEKESEVWALLLPDRLIFRLRPDILSRR